VTGSLSALWDDGQLQHVTSSLVQIESALDDLSAQLEATGAVPVPALHARYLLAVQRRGHAGAADEFHRWVTAIAERDAADSHPIASASAAAAGLLPWCPHCERAEQVEHLAAIGEHDHAVTLALPLLDAARAMLCPDQPVGVIAQVLPSLLLTGRTSRAVAEHVRGIRLLESTRDSEPWSRARAAILLLCARSGRLQHGLDLVQDWFGWLSRPGPPYLRLQASAAATRVLREVCEAGRPDLELEFPAGSGERVTAEHLCARLTRQARDLAAAFDTRNRTQAASGLVDDILDAEPLPDLPLDALLPSSRRAQVPVRRPAGAGHGGRRAVQDAAPAVTAREPAQLVREFDAALAADSASRRIAVLSAWEARRAQHVLDVGAAARDVARLDAWRAIELLQPSPAADSGRQPPSQAYEDPLADALAAAHQLAATGLPLESLLHEQATLLAAAQQGLARAPAVRHRIEEIAQEVAAVSGAADQGLAHSRVALIHELMTTDPAGPGAASAADSRVGYGRDQGAHGDAVELGLAVFGTVPLAELGHQHRRALCRLLRLRAGDEAAPDAVATLEYAISVLPDGVRPLERAMARADLASVLQERDPAAATRFWQGAVDDAASVDAEGLLATLLAAGAQAKQAAGDVEGAIRDLTEAVPLLDRHSPPELAAQSRFDLSRALLAGRRFDEAATAAESALADLTELMTRRLAAGSAGPRPAGAGEPAGQPGPPGRPFPAASEPTLAHLAGCAAFVAGEAIAATGDRTRARVLAELSAGWHESNGNLVAESEAWQLAAQIGGPPRQVAADLERAAELADAAGEWSRAANHRRDRAAAIKDADGVDVALAVLDDAEKTLSARDLAGRHLPAEAAEAAARLLTWHRLVLREQRARYLAVAGRFDEALLAVEGLEDGYLSLGDAWSARDLLGLRGQLRAELGDLGGALDDLERAAQEASEAGDRDQARGLGERLAMVLGESGRTYAAEEAYQRYSH
jgi:tetratricopeptide (TPR) repeat protein